MLIRRPLVRFFVANIHLSDYLALQNVYIKLRYIILSRVVNFEKAAN